MSEVEPSLELPDQIWRKIEKDWPSFLLWGWDRQHYHLMRASDALPLAYRIEDRLSARALEYHFKACDESSAQLELALSHLRRAELFESAARGWRRLIVRLIEKKIRAA